jgi:Predicted glutamine amidotransferases
VTALENAGLVPLIVPPLSNDAASAAILDSVSGLVLTGGEDVIQPDMAKNATKKYAR